MKKIWLMAMAVIFGFSACAKEDVNVIKIALVCPLTGDIAAMGQGMKRAAQMAIDEENLSGRLAGFKLELAAFDDRADPKEAVNIANQIISDNKIYGVIGHLNSGCSIPASSVYNRINLVMLSPASTNPKLTLQGLKNVFRVCTTDDVQGTYAADYIFNKLQKNNVCIIQDKTAYGQGIADNFKNRFEELGGKVISFDGINTGDKDFKALLTTIKSKSPQIIYFGGVYAEVALVTKQAKELGISAPVFSDDGSFSSEFIKIAGNSSEGSYFSMVGAPPEKLAQAQVFMNSYKEKYPGVDMQPYDPYTYEAVKIILEAIIQVGKNKLILPEHLASMKYNGILGQTQFDANGDTLNKTISIYKVVDGKFVYVE